MAFGQELQALRNGRLLGHQTPRGQLLFRGSLDLFKPTVFVTQHKL